MASVLHDSLSSDICDLSPLYSFMQLTFYFFHNVWAPKSQMPFPELSIDTSGLGLYVSTLLQEWLHWASWSSADKISMLCISCLLLGQALLLVRMNGFLWSPGICPPSSCFAVFGQPKFMKVPIFHSVFSSTHTILFFSFIDLTLIHFEVIVFTQGNLTVK